MATVRLDNVTKRYPDGTTAVRGMDLSVQDGEFLILVGPSGCGKTTALRMIAGLEDITDGTLRIGDRVVNDMQPKERDIAMVFQNYALYPHMTVEENMGFALRLAREPKPTIRDRVRETAGRLDLSTHLMRRPANLSGGQRQRVAMGRAMVRDPRVFLMDEPLSNLDAKLRVQMRVELSRLQQRLGTTTIYVTHDQTEAMTLGDRVAVMRDGIIQQLDTPERLYEHPANRFVAGFIGTPPMNFISAHLHDGALRLPFGELRVATELRERMRAQHDDREVTVGFRPEALGLQSESDPGLAFTARAEVVESVGSDVYVHFDSQACGGESRKLLVEGDGHAVAARLPGGARVRPGDDIPFALDPAGLCLFDANTGESLLSGDRSSAPMVGVSSV